MPTLGKLSINVSQPEDIDIGSANLANSYTDAMRRFGELGLICHWPPKSGFKGELPKDITSLGDDELGDLLNNLGQWCGYIAEELAKADAGKRAAEAELEFVRASVRIAVKAAYLDAKLTVGDRTDLTQANPRVVNAQCKQLYWETLWLMTRAKLESAQRDWETISRRITQRGQDLERMKREHNVAGTPIVSHTSSMFRRG